MWSLEQWVSRPLDHKILAYKASTPVLQAQTHAISSYIQREFAMHMEYTINTNGVTSSCPVSSVHFTLPDLDSTGWVMTRANSKLNVFTYSQQKTCLHRQYNEIIQQHQKLYLQKSNFTMPHAFQAASRQLDDKLLWNSLYVKGSYYDFWC